MRRIFCTFLLLTLPLVAYAYNGDYILEERYKELLPSAISGNAESQFEVGEMLERGRGVNKDLTAAFTWYSKSAELGNTKGAFKTGLAYLKGYGVQKDPEAGLKWLQFASERGYERANYYLGVMYEKGEGVATNLTRALSHYNLALSAGYAPAGDRINAIKAAIEAEERQQAARVEAEARKALHDGTKAQKVSSKPPLTTKELLLKGGWNANNQPAEYLPSQISKCTESGASIECMSKEVNRDIGTADITYQTKAVIYSMDDNGAFKISYRNLVKKVSPKGNSKEKIPVTQGWQDAEHVLECALEAEAKVNCTKDKIRKVSFTRK